MAVKYKLTRPELKRYRDLLSRYSRYLPMLKLKQQQLQMMLREVGKELAAAREAVRESREAFARYEHVLANVAGLPVRELATPQEVLTSRTNVAGVELPVFEDAVFPQADYSLFGTPAWVDQTLLDLRELNRRQARCEILQTQMKLLSRELTRIVQRVNLFEKIKIPEAQEGIRVIRIKLGDEMTAAVGRAKIAKTKLSEETGPDITGSSDNEDGEDDDDEAGDPYLGPEGNNPA